MTSFFTALMARSLIFVAVVGTALAVLPVAVWLDLRQLSDVGLRDQAHSLHAVMTDIFAATIPRQFRQPRPDGPTRSSAPKRTSGRGWKSIAEPGGIVLSYETWALVSDIIQARALEPISLKGISRIVVPYVVEALPDDAQTGNGPVVKEDCPGARIFLDVGRVAKGERARLA